MPMIRCAAFLSAARLRAQPKLFDLERQVGARCLAAICVVYREAEDVGAGRSPGQIDRHMRHVVDRRLTRSKRELAEAVLTPEDLPVWRSHLEIDHEF